MFHAQEDQDCISQHFDNMLPRVSASLRVSWKWVRQWTTIMQGPLLENTYNLLVRGP